MRRNSIPTSLLPLCLVLAAVTTYAQGSNKDLLDLVQRGQKSGQTDTQILQAAVKKGWDEPAVARAMAAVRLLKGETPEAAKAALPAISPDYRIGSGDVLQIVVWKEPEASVPQAVVRADGKISMPLIKEVTVAGMTPAELEKTLIGRLAQFINGADVTVIPTDIRSAKIYLAGAVKKEGPLPLTTPITVFQALNEAGGLTDYAKKKKIYVLREENGKQVRLPFDYSEVIKGSRMEQNIHLRPGDTIVVPQ